MRNSKKISLANNEIPALNATKNRGLRAALVGAVALLGVAGCTTDEAESGSDYETRTTGLVAFDSCDDLLGYFQAEASSDISLGYGYGYGMGVSRGLGAPEPAFAEDSQGSGAPTAGGEGGANRGDVPGFSGTNVQERGVDEADLVKTDGRFIYTVRNGHLLVIQAEGLAPQSDVTLDFNATQLLLSGNQLLVLGDLYGAPNLAGVQLSEEQRYRGRSVAVVYDVADRAAPRVLRTMYVDGYLVAARLTGRLARLVIHHDPSLVLDPINVPGGMGGAEPGVDVSPPIATPDDPGSAGEPRDGGAGPAQPADATPAEPPQSDDQNASDAGAGVDPQQAWLDAVKAQIAATTVDQWVPQVIDVDAQGHTTQRRAAECTQFFRPGERSGLGSTVVLTVDFDQPGATLPDPAVVSATGIVYASGDNLYLATVNWSDFIGPAMAVDFAPSAGVSSGGSTPGSAGTGGGTATGTATSPDAPPAMERGEQAQTAEDASQPDAREATQLHKLSLPAAGAARYLTSGRVHGQLLNQFSLSEFQGHLRVATTEHNTAWFGGAVRGGDVAIGGTVGVEDTAVAPPAQTEPAPAMERAQQAQAAEAPRSVTRVTVFDGDLTAVGQTEDVAPNEEIFAVRFIDDRGFVVTFEQKDPLFTVDLSTPSAPRIVGQLDVFGYSTYLHPVDADHLLGIGRSADENGSDTGMQLSLFDVTDFAAPALDFNLLLGAGWSDAQYDHHAVTFYEGMLMLPLSAWTEEGGIDGLEIFGVDVTEGIVRKGSIDHRELAAQDGYAHVERSLVIGDVIYSISNVGLIASDRADLSEIGHVVFPAPAGGRGGEDKPVDAVEPQVQPAEEPSQGT